MILLYCKYNTILFHYGFYAYSAISNSGFARFGNTKRSWRDLKCCFLSIINGGGTIKQFGISWENTEESSLVIVVEVLLLCGSKDASPKLEHYSTYIISRSKYSAHMLLHCIIFSLLCFFATVSLSSSPTFQQVHVLRVCDQIPTILWPSGRVNHATPPTLSCHTNTTLPLLMKSPTTLSSLGYQVI